jgi:hypothetical protein
MILETFTLPDGLEPHAQISSHLLLHVGFGISVNLAD